MISNTFMFKSGNNITGSDPIISELFKAFEIQRPVAPKWDLAYVLTSLCKEPFEPLHQASMLFLTMQITFFSGYGFSKTC